jgi:predicted aspartyl protease
MTLVANGPSRSFFYETPSLEAANEGAKTGSLSFEGQMINGQYVGIAYAFDSRCGEIPYKVSGPISDNYLSVVLEGPVPRFGLNCLQGYSNESLEFKLLNSGNNGLPLDLSPNAVTSPNAPTAAVAIQTVKPTSAQPSPINQRPSVEVLTGSSALVPLQKEGRGYVVPVLINNAITLNFVIDSGADDVSIPADVVLTLFRTGTLTEADFIGSVTYTLADGSRVPSKTFRINSLTVGTKKIENVIGSIAPVRGSLLLGQSFLGRFSSWSIDNAKQSLVLRW